MIFSASRLKLWGSCPLAAHFKYDQRIPEEGNNAKAVFGTCIHTALEDLSNNEDLGQAQAIFVDLWTNPEKVGAPVETLQWPRRTDFSGLKARGLDVLRDVHERTKYDHRVVLATEHPFLVPFGDHELTGFVDLLEVRTSGKGKDLLRIVDWKSAGRLPNYGELYMDIQFSVYVLASLQPEFWFGNGPDFPAMKNAQSKYDAYFDLPRRSIWYQLMNSKEIDAGPRDDQDFMRLYRLCEQVQRAIDHQVFVPKIGEHCGWCFSGDTRIITRDGTRDLRSLVGTSPEVLTRQVDGAVGFWASAPVRSFGRQRIWELTLTRNGRTKVISTTGDHRWLVRPARTKGRPARGNTPLSEVATADLAPGQRMASCLGGNHPRVRPSAYGIAHGFTFGDGSRWRGGSSVVLYGAKDEMLKWFPLSPTTIKVLDDQNAPHVKDLPGFFKDFPSLRESKSYLLGWLLGYHAADGTVSKGGQVSISSAVKENLEFVRDVCTLLGIGTHGLTKTRRLGRGRVETDLWEVELMRETLTADMFLRAPHREKFRPASSRSTWVVVSVEKTDRFEEVFCATVPDTHAFVLEDHILTRNCAWKEPCGIEIPTPASIAAQDDAWL